MLTDDGPPVRRRSLGLAAAAPATLIPKAALLFALCACSSPAGTQPRASRESQPRGRAPEKISPARDGALLSRRLLTLAPPAGPDVQRPAPHASPGHESIDLPFKGTSAPARVVLYRAIAPAHGIVFYGGHVSDDNRELVIQLLASRGYHVVVSDMLELYVVNAQLVAWARVTLGELPFACVDVHRCEPDRDAGAGSGAPAGSLTRPAAIVDDEIWPADPCHAGCAGAVPELVLVGRYPRGLLTVHDEGRVRCAEKRDRASAVVTGVTFRARRDLQPVGEFAIIEAFLAQHLGGRAESLDLAELRRAGLRVTYGLDHVTVLASHHDLELVPVVAAARATLAAGFTDLLGSVRGAVTSGCAGLGERLERLSVPATLARSCESDEFRVLASRFREEGAGVVTDAGCEDDFDAAAHLYETLLSPCEH